MLKFASLVFLTVFGISTAVSATAQNAKSDSDKYYNEVKTYVNPVLPGDHPDPTLLKVGNDFYHCGSSFHFNPYLPVYHSKDLVHWQIISRVVPPAYAEKITDKPSAGVWQGAISYFYGSYWIYFSANGQWFCKAKTPYGPWSAPVAVKTPAATGPLGYDNSIFVDDDGKPYMLIKNGQKVNRIQAIGYDGQLTDTVINLDWINAKLQYSWAEGPVMCKRKGYYYYFPAGDVSGGQFVLRTKTLTSDSNKWERLGNFFKPITDPQARFRNPNHISAPIQLSDGSWWTLGQSYERLGNDDWAGMGRQTSLFPVIWEGDRPWGMAPVSTPINRPNLPQAGILWRSVQSDYFDEDTLALCWHFLNRTAATNYSLTARKGWIRLTPAGERTHLLQKETDHFYSAVTCVDLNAMDTSTEAGIYLTNGDQKVNVRLYTCFDHGKKIIFQLGTMRHVVVNPFGNKVWLKLQRYGHKLMGYFSKDGITWTSLGVSISAISLDRTQPNFNSWVGTSIGLFAEGKPADFDFFICKDGFSELPAIGYSNYFGIKKVFTNDQASVTNTSDHGGWLMISGVDIGKPNYPAKQIKVSASSSKNTVIEIWLDDLKNGQKIATIPVPHTNVGNWETCIKPLKGVYGHHDVFIKFMPGSHGSTFIKSISFTKVKTIKRN
ncbi:MAG: family 43 glycosylhydrolase [Mucilaginibacter sp.]